MANDLTAAARRTEPARGQRPARGRDRSPRAGSGGRAHRRRLPAACRADARLPTAAWSPPAWASPATSRARSPPRSLPPARRAFYVHPGEAGHGDLGMITDADVVLALSYSGETDELLMLLPVLKRQGNRLIAMTGRAAIRRWRAKPTCTWTSACPPKPARSTWRRLPAPPRRWRWAMRWRSRCWKRAASPPTISRVRIRPAALGRRLLLHITDVMHAGDDVPRVRAERQPQRGAGGDEPQAPGHDRGGRRRRPAARAVHRRRPAPHAGRRSRIDLRNARIAEVMTRAPEDHRAPTSSRWRPRS